MVRTFVIAVEDGLCSWEKPFHSQLHTSFHLANQASKQLLLIYLLKQVPVTPPNGDDGSL